MNNFLMYHQINELLFKMILWEIEQVAFHENLKADFFSSRLDRISHILIYSLGLSKHDECEVAQYMKFKSTAPASGFQSAQMLE